MKKNIVFGLAALMAASVVAADSTPKDDVTASAKALADKSSYSWTTTVTVPPDSQFHPGPTEGKTEKGGYTHVSMTFGDNTTEFVLQGTNFAIHTEDNGWQAPSEMDQQGPRRFMAGRMRNFKAPAVQATDILAGVKELKKNGDVYSGDLTEDGAKALLQFGRRGGGANVSNAKGSAKFWIKDGVLSKFESKVTGTVSFNGNDVDVDRTTTTEIKDVGTTKVVVPDEAKKKLS